MMITFFKLLYYKFFRLLEKYSKGSEDHCSFNAFLFSTLFLFLNLVVIFFFTTSLFNINLSDKGLLIATLVTLFVVFIIFYKLILSSKQYIENNNEISRSKFKGRYGNVLVGLYIGTTFLSLFILLLFFLHENKII